MINAYVYVFDTLADWEIGYITAELNSRRFFKKDAPELTLKTVSTSKDPIHTMGGMTILPDCTPDQMVIDKSSVLLLPGGNTWSAPLHKDILKKAAEFLDCGATVAAICGATLGLAGCGLLDTRPHTSNGKGFIEMFCPKYKGQDFYRDEPSVSDGNLITSSGTSELLWAKLIIEHLEVFKPDTLEAWYQYWCKGTPECFHALLKTMEQ